MKNPNSHDAQENRNKDVALKKVPTSTSGRKRIKLHSMSDIGRIVTAGKFIALIYIVLLIFTAIVNRDQYVRFLERGVSFSSDADIITVVWRWLGFMAFIVYFGAVKIFIEYPPELYKIMTNNIVQRYRDGEISIYMAGSAIALPPLVLFALPFIYAESQTQGKYMSDDFTKVFNIGTRYFISSLIFAFGFSFAISIDLPFTSIYIIIAGACIVIASYYVQLFYNRNYYPSNIGEVEKVVSRVGNNRRLMNTRGLGK
ncbi:MAG: hypothetical protein ACRC67_18285 [Inquilinus sp.]|uniref:hypothetical protein n=1 Tax=Inquilinus sp. TaxID=1932117 RepID=UPI003F32C5DA